jgi:superfamily II DNA or RNA helicase
VALDLIAARGGPEAIGPVLFTAPNLTVAAWMAEQIRTRGWTSEAAIPAHGRRAIRSLIRAFGAGEPQTLVTVDLLAEGVTIPSLRALALCAAPRGRNHLCQVAGRVMGTCAPDRWGVKS